MFFSFPLSITVILCFIFFWSLSYYFKKAKHEKISRLLFAVAPIVSFLFILNFYGDIVMNLFILFMALGTLSEYLFGYIYHKIYKKKLWEYKIYKIGREGYTSYLSIPFWGLAGLMFWGFSLIFY